MSYSNLINKLSSETKKALEESASINKELQAAKYGLKNYNKNSIGFKYIFTFEIDNEIKNNYYLVALEILINYILEFKIFKNNYFINYQFYIYKTNLKLAIFHSNKRYLENIVNDGLINEIYDNINNISINVRNKFVEINLIPLKIKLKSIYKEYPILIDIFCNTINEKKIINKSNEVLDCLIKLLFINDINISRNNQIILTTYKSQEEPITFLTQFSISDKENEKEKRERKIDNFPPSKKIKFSEETLCGQMENVNNNLKQLFWHTMDNIKPLKKNKSSYWKHSIIFILILTLIFYSLPNYVEKIFNYSKNSSVIDNILDLATDDLTATATNFKTNNFSRNIDKLDTIKENTFTNSEPAEPAEPAEPGEPSEDIGIITRNIIKNFDLNEKNNLDIKSIENRLKLILEETSSNN